MVSDMLAFFVLYAPFVLAFSLGFTILFDNQDAELEDETAIFGSFWLSFRTLVLGGILGDTENSIQVAMESTYYWILPQLALFLYLVVGLVLLLNMLIAVSLQNRIVTCACLMSLRQQ